MMRNLAIFLLAAIFLGAASPAHKYATISGIVTAIDGSIAQLRESDGTTVAVDESSLIAEGQPLTLGGHFAVHGYFRKHVFIAQPNPSGGGNGYPPPGATATVRGIVASMRAGCIVLAATGAPSITVNDQLALDKGMGQALRVGAGITALGYWSGSTFYAVGIVPGLI